MAERSVGAGVNVYEGGLGYEVHADDGWYAIVDADSQREWGQLDESEAFAIYDALKAALGSETSVGAPPTPTCGPLGTCQVFVNGGMWCSGSCEIRTPSRGHVPWFARLRARIFGWVNSVVSGSDAREERQ